MNHSFVVYVDESGDEGFKFSKDDGPGSSKWFVLSAVGIRAHNDRQIIEKVAKVRELLNRPKNFALHFRKLKHEQRIPYVRAISELPIRSVSVLINKPCITEPETFAGHRLYHFGVRLLLERVSWLCHQSHSHRSGSGDGSARIIFSNRSSMSYDELREYVGGLMCSSSPLDVRIEPTVIKPEQIEAKQHAQWAGLQIADAVASSFYFATEIHKGDFTEPRYVQELSRIVYRKDAEGVGYGVKFWPSGCDKIIRDSANLKWVNQWFGKK